MWGEPMLLWPAVSLVGFLVLTALVIALGTRSTARYEREQRAAVFADNTAVEPAGMAAVS
jgi:membrane protein implicated in regulation of membrane protease activity